MNVDLGIWGRLTRLVVFLLCMAGLLGLAIPYLPVIKQNERMRKRILLLGNQIQQGEAHAKQLKASIEALRRDPKAVERSARERLGYATAGETMIRFEAPVTNALSRR